MIRNFLIAVFIIGALGGCKKNSNSCNYDACAVKASASEISSVQNYLTANSITATQHCSGLFYRIENPGTGATPNACSTVSVTYTGTLTNGSQFDASSSPISLGLDQVILGWRNGLTQIKAGGTIDLYIPPTLGYGSQPAGTIPANSILIFKVNLVSVQ